MWNHHIRFILYTHTQYIPTHDIGQWTYDSRYINPRKRDQGPQDIHAQIASATEDKRGAHSRSTDVAHTNDATATGFILFTQVESFLLEGPNHNSIR